LLYGVMLLVLLGPNVAGQFFHKFFGFWFWGKVKNLP
jgi:hypothetical protein